MEENTKPTEAIEKTETPEAPVEKAAPKKAEPKVEFKIDADKKRYVQSSVAGQTIEVLKRASAPISLSDLANRVKSTKVGKELNGKVADMKGRVKAVVEWHVKEDTKWVQKDADGNYFLTRA